MLAQDIVEGQSEMCGDERLFYTVTVHVVFSHSNAYKNRTIIIFFDNNQMEDKLNKSLLFINEVESLSITASDGQTLFKVRN